MAPASTSTPVRIFPQSPEAVLPGFIGLHLAIVAVIVLLPIVGLCIGGTAYLIRERKRRVRYRAIAAHFQKGGQPPSGGETIPVGYTPVTAPPNAYAPVGTTRTDHQIISTIPYPEASHSVNQRQQDAVTKFVQVNYNTPGTTLDAHSAPAPTFHHHFSSTAGRSTAPPSRVPSYYAHTPRSSIIPPLVNQGRTEEGWNYISTPPGSPPPPEIGHP